MYNIEGKISTVQADQCCDWTQDDVNQLIVMLCGELRLNSKIVMPMSSPGFSKSKTILLVSFYVKYPSRTVSMTSVGIPAQFLI